MNDVPVVETYSNEVLYREYFTPLYRFIFFRTRDYDTAIDLTQTAFLKFISQKSRPQDNEHALKLLYVIARNTLIDYRRNAHTRLSMPSTKLDLEIANTSTPEEEQKQTETKDFLENIVTTLTETEQEIVSLRTISDLSYEDIAELMRLKPDNCRKIYSRALKTIKQRVTSSNYFK